MANQDKIECTRCNYLLPMNAFRLKSNKIDHYKQCIGCNEKIRNSRANNKCPHNKSKAYCKLCGGSAYCTHNNIKAQCKECHGSAICIHNKNKAYCKLCKGSAFCEHDKQKDRCKDCNKYGHLKDIVTNRMREALKKRDLKVDIEYLNVDIEMYYEILSYLNRDTEFTWDNYGDVWQIDHIKPLGEKGITDEELIKRLSWCNTRPLSALENSKKSNKPFIEPVETRSYKYVIMAEGKEYPIYEDSSSE